MMKTAAMLAALAALAAPLTAAESGNDGPAAALQLRVLNRSLSIDSGEKPLAVVEALPTSRELALNILADPESGRTFQLTVPSAVGFRFRQTLGNNDAGSSAYALYLNFNGIFTLRSGGFETFTAADGSAMRRTWEYIYEFTPRTAYLLQTGLREAPADEAAGFLENATYRADERKLAPEPGGRLAGSGPLFEDFAIPEPLPQTVNAGAFKVCKLADNRFCAAEVSGLPGRSFVMDFSPATGVLRMVFFNGGKSCCQVEFNSSDRSFKAFFTGAFRGMAYSVNLEDPEPGKALVRAKTESGGEAGEFFFRLDPADHTFRLDDQKFSGRN